MKFYGHANLQKNQLQNAALETLSAFPTQPVVGQLAFVNSIVYICVTAGSLPIWVPLTREITVFTYTEANTSSLWDIVHNLNTTSVNVQVYDSSNRMIIPNDIEVASPSNVKISLNTGMNGRAVILSGHFDGNVKPTYSYTHYQSVASPTWIIVHGLGYNPIVRVFIGNQEVQPLSIVHDTVNQVTITFGQPQVGYARLI